MKRQLICINCPLGCSLQIEHDEERIISVKGNTCPRGTTYAETEIFNPQRVVTTTVRCSNGKILSVKTNKPIPKNKIFECMKIINSCKPSLPINSGDVIIENVFGADIIATNTLLR